MPLNYKPSGICDFHVHIGEKINGYELRDDFPDLEKIAQETGIAGIGAFVTEEAGLSLTAKLKKMQEKARLNYNGKVHWHLTPIHTKTEELFPLLQEGWDLKLYTTYKESGLYSSYEQIEHWMEELSDLKTRILVHCEDDRIITQSSAEHPFHTPLDHTLRRPELAEIVAIEKVLNLAIKHSHPIHIVHISSPKAAILVKEAKSEYPFITCETAPHYLIYNENQLIGENAHRWLCTPPFRSEESRGLLVELMQDGYFDIIASDHCPFKLEDKDRFKDNLPLVPCGIPGLGTIYSSMFKNFVEPEIISQAYLDEMTIYKPKNLMSCFKRYKYEKSFQE
ncbi:MAG: dihydroorotase family protein [Candidatus Cloacimonetes bacterium]|nr:dihydroorotase family protein [Candidatus Cloacimonadota bacterium]